MQKIVIDITSLVKWRRYPVGIIRTLLEFVRFSLDSFHDYRYVMFNDDKSELTEVDRSLVVKLIEEYNNESWDVDSNPKQSSIMQKNICFQRNIRNLYLIIRSKDYDRLVRAIYKRVPKPLTPYVRKIAEPFYRKMKSKKIIDGNKDITDAFFEPSIVLAKNEVGVLSSTDVFVTIGLDWDFSNYPLLVEMKKNIGFKVVACFYDAIPVTHPTLVSSEYFCGIFAKHLYDMVYLSDKVFCISDYSKVQLENYISDCFIDTEVELKTLHLGDDVRDESQDAMRNGLLNDTPYVIYVSTIEARKNHVLLLRAWKKLIGIYGDSAPRLVFVGMRGWGLDEFNNELKNFPKDFLFIKNNVSDKELAELYKNCLFGVFPSIVEGWGLGAAECLSYGKACLISDCPAISEATQGLMPSLSASDEGAWVEKVSELLDFPEKIDQLEANIRNSFKTKKWREFSEEFEGFVLR